MRDGETLPPSSLKTEQCHQVRARVHTLPIAPEAPSGGRWRRYWQSSQVIKRATPGHWANGKPAGQNSGNQPNLKETDTDYGSLVVLNSLPKTGLGLRVTRGGSRKKTAMNSGFYRDEFHHSRLHYLHYFSPA